MILSRKIKIANLLSKSTGPPAAPGRRELSQVKKNTLKTAPYKRRSCTVQSPVGKKHNKVFP